MTSGYCAGADTTPPVGTAASAVLVDFAGCADASFSLTLLTFDAVVDAIGQIEGKRRPAAG